MADTNFAETISEDLDVIDRRLIDRLQRAIPLTSRPWDEVGETLGLRGDEVLARLRRLCEQGVVRKLGPIIDSKKVGLRASTLVAMKVPLDRIHEIAAIISRYDEVSHNYQRDHPYNLWFTLTAPAQDDLARILHDISKETGVPAEDSLNLPTERLFKIKAIFKIR
ncbi:MAG: AsnC family transcriptional regulator [bacterium]|nr:AsnC family transcriptional regulator [bacterium]